MTQQLETETLADHRRSLQRRFVARRKAVEARQDDALDRRGHGALVSAALQQLHEKEWIALRALNAAKRKIRSGSEERSRQRERFTAIERREIEGFGPVARPRRIDRIAVASRCEKQDDPRAQRA